MLSRSRRGGSPWTGLGVVIAKETADHLGGIRMVLIEAIVFLIALVLAWFSTASIRDNIGESPFVFLFLFQITPEWIPFSFIGMVSLVTPVVAIALGFDAINAEFNQRTMSRLLAQPIYRDALLLGKFLARLLALTIALVSLWLLVLGIGLLRLGLPPSTEEMVRMLGFLVATIAYGGVWLALAVMFSVLFRAPATAALAGLGTWLSFALFWSVVSRVLATLIAGPPEDIFGPRLAYLQFVQFLDRLSPIKLFADIAVAMLQPEKRFLGPVLVSQLQGALFGSPLPASQSFALIWPQLTGLVAATILIFAIAYVFFQRQEIRA
ncbi:MAG TPA: ABC transporter permease subunit [Stellaceae bacterium]|jgi:ABC-2 type transport system permease protein|nr:ABC transporter permease subunit [Stellaceae bacterium]